MKLKILLSISVLSIALSCKKNGNTNSIVATESTDKNSVGLVQPAVNLVAENGSTIKIVYYAEGEKVAAKITKNTESERKFLAAGVSESGNPTLSDGKMEWEISNDGTGGTLVNEKGIRTVYKMK